MLLLERRPLTGDALDQIGESGGLVVVVGDGQDVDALDLKIHYRPGDRSLDIEVTLAGEHVCSVPPAGAVTGLRRRRVSLAVRAKIA